MVHGEDKLCIKRRRKRETSVLVLGNQPREGFRQALVAKTGGRDVDRGLRRERESRSL